MWRLDAAALATRRRRLAAVGTAGSGDPKGRQKIAGGVSPR